MACPRCGASGACREQHVPGPGSASWPTRCRTGWRDWRRSIPGSPTGAAVPSPPPATSPSAASPRASGGRAAAHRPRTPDPRTRPDPSARAVGFHGLFPVALKWTKNGTPDE